MKQPHVLTSQFRVIPDGRDRDTPYVFSVLTPEGQPPDIYVGFNKGERARQILLVPGAIPTRGNMTLP